MKSVADNLPDRILPAALFFVVCLILLTMNTNRYLPFLADDALISLRYADRLLDGKGLTWTDGRPVEGYSNLLWLLLVAGLGAVGFDLIVAARTLGMLGMIGAVLAVVAWYARAGSTRTVVLAVPFGLLFFVLAAPVGVWAIGGLEQPLSAAALAAAIPLYWWAIESDRPAPGPALAASFALGLLCLTRPDGPIFTVAAGVAAILGCRATNRPAPWRFLLLLVTFPILFTAGQLAFRLAYYGEWVPNTALVKITPSSYHLRSGMAYASDGLLALAPFSFLAFAGILAALSRPERQERALLLFMMTAFWLVYLIAIGGDVFPAFRHLIPIIVVCAYGLIEGIDLLLARLKEKPGAWTVAAVAFLAVLLVPYAVLQSRHPEYRRAIEERWEWDGKAIGKVLKGAFSDAQPLLAVTAAGCLPYWSELPCIDMMGLNDHHIARHRPPDIGRGIVGHELGDGDYVLRRRPDIVCFHTGTRNARFRSGREMAATEEFQTVYTPVTLHTAAPHEYEGTIWVRKDSEKIGIRKTSDTIVIPGFLLNANRDTVASLYHGRLAVAVRRDQPAGIVLEDIARSDWAVELRGLETEAVVTRLDREGTTLTLELSTDALMPALVHEVVLRETGQSPEP